MEATAKELATLLRELADACEAAAKGDKAAKRLLEAHTDSRWFGLVVGAGKVQELTADEN